MKHRLFVTPNSPTHLGAVKGKRCLFLQTSKEGALQTDRNSSQGQKRKAEKKERFANPSGSLRNVGREKKGKRGSLFLFVTSNSSGLSGYVKRVEVVCDPQPTHKLWTAKGGKMFVSLRLILAVILLIALFAQPVQSTVQNMGKRGQKSYEVQSRVQDILHADTLSELRETGRKRRDLAFRRKLCEQQKTLKTPPHSCYPFPDLRESADIFCLQLGIKNVSPLSLNTALSETRLSRICRKHLKKLQKILNYRKKDVFVKTKEKGWTK